MARFALRRLLAAVPVLLGVTFITFVLMWIIPGDATQSFMDPKIGTIDPEVLRAARKVWGLDAPFLVQYGKYLGNLLRGDLGYSYLTNERVWDAIAQRLPATGRLALAAMVISTALGVSAGVFTALRRGSLVDAAGMIVTLAGVSVPTFWLGLLLMWWLAVRWAILPATGYGRGELSYLVLPAVTVGLSYAGAIARLARSATLDVIGADYVRTARAKGAGRRTVVARHVLPNAMIPVLTLIGINLGGMLSGSVIAETVFSWPGIGSLLVDAIQARNLLLVQGCVLVFAVIFIAVNVLVDLLYGLLDPRIRYA
ncbi:MAG: ABC transporter permease [Armatimonadota bacterium]|nr:ABC transporter permease [Armatimonadota bacterium]MDR7468296.1 ABC transporter permease [Armatimonadota bacterium]MDR7494688.1 ABC transporter permease [Armatimonadota bacterium]MDR7500234.1 ABC transporter permease [Armatimonadota bacterium]MDR7505614.1 ABC transporter permease [Armatimonadota bacterium]